MQFEDTTIPLFSQSYNPALHMVMRFLNAFVKFSKEQYSIKETTLYSAFTRLEKNGYIESFPGEVTHGKKRTYYQITHAGERYLEEKLLEWEVTKDVVEAFVKEMGK